MNWTVQGLLDWATGFFKGKNIESPHLESEILLAYALQCKRLDLYLRFEQAVAPEALARFKEAVIRRTNKEPVAYITGNKSFFSLEFKITTDVLIPRPETETLVESALEFLSDLKEKRDPQAPLRIVDVGTGSGIVAVCLAKFFPAAHVLAIDISEAVLAVARENAEKLGVSDRVQFAQGSLLEPLRQLSDFSQPDLIVSNPPYISDIDFERLDESIRNFEPMLALKGGADGLDIILSLIGQASERLGSNGQLMVEIGFGQDKLLSTLKYPKLNLNGFTRDMNGIPRVVRFKKSAVSPAA